MDPVEMGDNKSASGKERNDRYVVGIKLPLGLLKPRERESVIKNDLPNETRIFSDSRKMRVFLETEWTARRDSGVSIVA